MVQPRPGLGYATVAIAATLFAVHGTVSNVILGSGISSGQLTAVRYAGALIVLALIAAATRPRSLLIRTGDLPLLIALGISQAVVQYFFAIHRLDIGIALLIGARRRHHRDLGVAGRSLQPVQLSGAALTLPGSG